MTTNNECHLNCKRLALGGLAAGLWISLVEWVAHVQILGPRYSELTNMGLYVNPARFPFMPAHLFLNIVCGFVLAWLYSAVRETLKPGAKTAIKLGFAVFLIAGLPGNVAEAAWAAAGRFIPFVDCLAMFANCIGGALIAGALYCPRGANESCCMAKPQA